MVLLVGLTELKAQIAWIDSVTVSIREILSFSPRFLIFTTSGSRGRRKGSKFRLQSPAFIWLNSFLRTDAVVVYDNPSERITNDDAEW